MRILTWLFTSILFTNSLVQSSRILAVFPMASPSHYILANAYLKALANKGHDVTIISPFTNKEPPKNGSYREIVLTGMVELHQNIVGHDKLLSKMNKNPLFNVMQLMDHCVELTEKTLNDTGVQKLMKSNEKFDVVVIAQLVNEAVKALANHFNGHLIIFNTIGPSSVINPLIGNPNPTSYVSEMILSFPSKMNFLQRMTNTLAYIASNLFAEYLMHPPQQKLMEKYFPNASPYKEVIYNASLVLLNSHESINPPVPYVPCMINIGGFHIQEGKKLPKDLQEFLDNAKEGVIYFSLGSNMKSNSLPEATRNAFLNSFSKLKQKVLWKWEDEVLPGQPDNVKLGKWLPQQDILAHPNVKAFITHGGLLSTIETIHFGVPIIAIPIFGDQKMNAYTAEAGGYCLVLPIDEVTEEKLIELLNEILTDPKYSNNAKTRSRLMHDRPMKPMDSAIYWTEYVIRNNGARHLRMAGLDLSWYQHYLLDIVALIFIVLTISIIAIKKMFVFLKFCICTKKDEKIKTN